MSVISFVDYYSESAIFSAPRSLFLGSNKVIAHYHPCPFFPIRSFSVYFLQVHTEMPVDIRLCKLCRVNITWLNLASWLLFLYLLLFYCINSRFGLWSSLHAARH